MIMLFFEIRETNNDVEFPKILAELLSYNDEDGLFHCEGIG